MLRYGVWTARRAWLGPAQIRNTLPWPELRGRRSSARASSAGSTRSATTRSTLAALKRSSAGATAAA